MVTSTGGPPAHFSRRRLLVGAGAVALVGPLAGCSGDDRPTPPVTPAPPPPDPDAGRRAAAVASATSLVAAYEATTAAHPSLAALLTPLLADHRLHRDVLAPADAAGGTPSPGVGATSSAATAGATAGAPAGGPGTASPAPSVPVPPDPVAAQAALLDSESVASMAARTDAVGAVDAALARLLAAVAASRAVHAVLLVP